MAQAQRYRLKLSRLDFVSLVDDPAQPNAKTLLIKRKGKADEVTARAKVVKTSDELGLAFFWAFTSTNADGSDHFDHHGDTVDQDFIKAAMDFMTDAAGAVDEMHDYEATDGRVVFAMPMTPDIAKAFGIVTKTAGLMVALKVNDEQLAKLKNGTYTGVSIAGLGTREPLSKSTRVAKGQLYTNEVDGHQHKLDVYDDGSFWCCYATSTGAENSHNHGVVFEDGKLTILADSGHTHELAEGQPGIVVVDPSALVIVASRSPHARVREESTRGIAGRSVNTTKANEGPKTMNDAEKLADLQKRYDRFALIVDLTGVEKAYFDTLTGKVAEEFLAKSSTDRATVLADVAKRNDEANKVIYTSKSTGDVYRSKDDPRMIEMAKRMDAQADEIEKGTVRELAKSTIGQLGGGDEVHDFIVRALRKSGGTDEQIKAALTAMKGWNDVAKAKATAPGFNGGGTPTNDDGDETPFETLEKGLLTFCKDNKIDADKAWTVGFEKFKATSEGAELKRAYDESASV